MGSSASYCCSLALGLLTLCNGDVSPANINRISYQGEKVTKIKPHKIELNMTLKVILTQINTILIYSNYI